MSLKDQLAEYPAGWYQRVPAERQAIMQRHIATTNVSRHSLKSGPPPGFGDRANWRRQTAQAGMTPR
jgi:hypothetical protein